ncbi:MAG: hypothetical protein LBB40_00945 [Holophagales bacterium]|nr:hypothetical protein [Holophagales bacterium]
MTLRRLTPLKAELQAQTKTTGQRTVLKLFHYTWRLRKAMATNNGIQAYLELLGGKADGR